MAILEASLLIYARYLFLEGRVLSETVLQEMMGQWLSNFFALTPAILVSAGTPF